MEFLQVDVFAEVPYEGNPLAVFPDAAGLSKLQMQSIAREMNLSETAFVTAVRRDEYEVRIFTPYEELPFAGHPTIGTAWVLREIGLIGGGEIIQRSAAGATKVHALNDEMWFERQGRAEIDLEDRDPEGVAPIAEALGVDPGRVGLEARELGRPGRLRPAFSDAGIRQLMVPLSDLAILEACRPRSELLGALTAAGVYCFTAVQAGRLRARGFFPSIGIEEDPATGSAAAALGLLLAARLGPIQLEIQQGVEIGRPSRIVLDAQPGTVRVGGRCQLAATGRLERLP
ncbi:PhzF family phenazine biosynthesis protein [soil metagenome]